MVKGPLGRVRINERCMVTLLYRCTGKPDPQGMQELEDNLHLVHRGDSKNILIESGRNRLNANTYLLVIGIDERVGLSGFDDRRKKYESIIEKHGSRIDMAQIAAGDPHSLMGTGIRL